MDPLEIDLDHITFTYEDGVQALVDLSLKASPGEFVVVLGANGAGKSTLCFLLSGIVPHIYGGSRTGKVSVAGRDPWDDPLYVTAQSCGVLLQDPEVQLFNPTVASELAFGPSNLKAPRQEILDRIQETLALLHLDGLERRNPRDLSGGQKQRVALGSVLTMRPRVLVLDEPTSALPASEVDVLHKVVRRLAEQGRAIIYVTHRLQEIPRVADSVTVLRDGKLIGTIPVAQATPARIAQMMIGTDWKRTNWGKGGEAGDVKLSVHRLRRDGVLHDISFDLRAGEVLGIAGLLGSGRTELVRAIFGRDPVDGGEIRVDGELIANASPTVMKAHGVALTPEDRKRQGLVLPFSLQDNLTLASLKRASIWGVLQRHRERSLAQAMAGSLDIKSSGLGAPTSSLSGGNQQKVVVGNWLNTLPSVLLMDEPTRGIDIQAKEQIFSLVRELASRGLAVLFISSEIEEVLDVSDRILVMNGGRITHEVKRDSLKLETLMELVMEQVA